MSLPLQTQSIHVVKKYPTSIKKAMDDVKTILKHFLEIQKPCAVVFDIDDTLIESEMGNGIKETKDLYHFCNKHKIPTFFITARLKEKEVIQETLKQLEEHGMQVPEENLKLSPASYRESFPRISQWKHKTREKIASQLGHQITFTIGDQWGDLIAINDHEYKKFNKEFYIDDKPPSAILMRPNDKVSHWGLKILSSIEKKDMGY